MAPEFLLLREKKGFSSFHFHYIIEWNGIFFFDPFNEEKKFAASSEFSRKRIIPKLENEREKKSNHSRNEWERKKIPFYQFSHLIDAFGCHTTANTHNQFVGANFFFRGPFLNNNNNNTTTH